MVRLVRLVRLVQLVQFQLVQLVQLGWFCSAAGLNRGWALLICDFLCFQDIQEPRYYELSDMLRAWTGAKVGERRHSADSTGQRVTGTWAMFIEAIEAVIF